jgi:hypothetical protein
MAALTTDILEVPTAGQAGFIAASNTPTVKFCRVTDAAVNCALAVCDGATPGQTCKVPTTAAEAAAAIGILVNPEFLNEVGAATDYLAAQQATILEEGYIWVNAEGTVAVGDPVYVRHTSDGGDNTTRGTMRKDGDYPAGGIVITPGASLTAAVQEFSLTLNNGLVTETFTFISDASPTAAEVSVGLVALIDASANFAATGTTTISVTSATGVVNVVSMDQNFTLTTPMRAARLKGARFASAVSGAGLAQVRLHNISRD